MKEANPKKRIENALKIDPATVERKLAAFIKEKVEEAKAAGVVLGLSGGVDSSVTATLCAKALGANKVMGVSMPEAGITDPHDVADAREVANKLSIEFRVVDITPAVLGVRQNLTDYQIGALLPGANIKPRVRMVILYYYANLLKRLVVGSGNRSELRAGYFCYDAQTRAFTKEGLKNYMQLSQGDTVLSLNLKTGKVEEKPIAGVYCFSYNGEMLHFSGKRTDLMVTPNHRMLARRRDGPLVFRTAEECFKKRISLPIPSPWEGKVTPSHFFDLSTFYDQRQLPWNAKLIGPLPAHEFLYLLGLFLGDGTAYSGVTRLLTKTGLDQRRYVESYRDKEGRFTDYPGPNPSQKAYSTYEIFFAIPIGDPARQSLEQILSRHGIRYSTTSNVVRIHSCALYEVFRTCGHGARHKRIPEWVLQYPAQELEWLFKGLMDSDGSRRGGTYYTSSYQLAMNFIEICVKTGRQPTIRVRLPKEREYSGKKIRSGTAYEITFPQKISSTSIYPDDVEKVQYVGTVWCPDIPETHNLLVERNGKFAFCGNTKYGDGGVDLLPLGCLYKTQVKELAAHLGLPGQIIEKVPTAGLWKGQTDEGELGISYEKLDMIYAGLDLKLKHEAIAKAAGVELDKVKHFIGREFAMAHKMRTPEVPSL